MEIAKLRESLTAACPGLELLEEVWNVTGIQWKL